MPEPRTAFRFVLIPLLTLSVCDLLGDFLFPTSSVAHNVVAPDAFQMSPEDSASFRRWPDFLFYDHVTHLGPLDMNEVNRQQLMYARGIGSVRAQQLLSYRDSAGGFSSWNQIREELRFSETLVGEMKKYFFINRRDK